ncbi:hypothetical protein AN390_01327 [Pseudoalteromonas sp. P1-11]|nr:hypothetical protein AN390_01327 [Pseudoalteromonas sp. P1-11]|tara:strand:- start:1609 stop:1767 length:159 start_codon:yes stop_codon:yes gene_type:complete
MLRKLLSFLATKLFTTKFFIKFVLFVSGKLVKSTKPKWDDELHAMIKEALES